MSRVLLSIIADPDLHAFSLVTVCSPGVVEQLDSVVVAMSGACGLLWQACVL